MENNAQIENKMDTVGNSPSIQRNFILKVKDANSKEIKDALKAKNIDVVSLLEVHQETSEEENG
jgi:hypothetical protein